MLANRRLLVFLVSVFWLTIFFIQIKLASVDLHEVAFFGDRRFAIFDFWTVQHFLSGVFIGFVILSVKKVQFFKYILLILLASLFWEMTELIMEYGLFGQSISNWKFGYELIYNRLVVDPLSVLIGGITFWYFRNTVYFAVVPLVIWFLINVMSPNSMYIQDAIFEYFKF